ncbi:MAG: SRPBCC family protein, partial [Solirubrobacterales bacterium]|nr:SRPBCC family protein [Solirubrobacterales bacterium]
MSDPSAVETTILIPATPEEVWAVALDPHRLEDWVTIHRKLHEAPDRPLREGDRIVQTLALRGAPFKVTWKVEDLDEPHRAVWVGRGPARSIARTEYRLEAKKKGTLFHYSNNFQPPGGPIGRIAANALVGGLPRTEAEASLKRLAALLS